MLKTITNVILNNPICFKYENLSQVLDEINKITQKEKYGDWDMIFHINKNLDSQVYKKIKTQLDKILLLILQKLKYDFTKLIYGEFSTNFIKLLDEIRSIFFKENDDLKKLMQEYKKNIKLNEIMTLGYSVKEQGICAIDKKILWKNSFVLKKRNKNNSTNDELLVKDYIELRKLLFDSKYNDLISLNNIEKNDLFINQNDLEIIIRHYRMDFTITRLKVNNIAIYKNNETGLIKTLSIPYELIDAVVIGQNDVQNNYIENKLEEHKKPMISLYNYENTKLKLPSVYYLYYDLESILIRQNVFIWEDKKYQKRIFRLIMLGIYALLVENIKIRQLLTILGIINIFFKNLKSKITFLDKYAIVKQYVKIVNDKIKINYNEIKQDLQYLEIVIEHYAQCIIILNNLFINSNENSEFVKNIFKYNIDYKEVPVSLFLTKPFNYYLEKDKNYYFEQIINYEDKMIEYTNSLMIIFNAIIDQNIVISNDIYSL